MHDAAKDMINSEIDKLTDSVLNEVYDFTRFLETKKNKQRLRNPLRICRRLCSKRYS